MLPCRRKAAVAVLRYPLSPLQGSGQDGGGGQRLDRWRRWSGFKLGDGAVEIALKGFNYSVAPIGTDDAHDPPLSLSPSVTTGHNTD